MSKLEMTDTDAKALDLLNAVYLKHNKVNEAITELLNHTLHSIGIICEKQIELLDGAIIVKRDIDFEIEYEKDGKTYIVGSKTSTPELPNGSTIHADGATTTPNP